MKDEGEGMCRYFGKPETMTKTLMAQGLHPGVTDSKENVAILYPYAEKGNRMGLTSKAAKAFWAERVFVDEPRVHLGRMEPDGTHLQIGHVPSPKGKKSTLTYYDYCENQEDNPLYATFTMSSMQDMVNLDMWQSVLLSMQRNGIGAIRSMGYGQCKIVAFERV